MKRSEELRLEQEKKDKKKVKEKEMERKERAEMTKWMTRLCKVCGLKTKKIEADSSKPMYTKPSDENNQPQESQEEQQENVPSDENSPTLSSASSAYIPISECFTGKPIHFNDKTQSNGKETVYYNTSFPFPPKVNWATHPAKKEHSPDTSSVPTPSSLPTPSPSSTSSKVKVRVITEKKGPHVPPRPPKKNSVDNGPVPGIAITVPELDTPPVETNTKTRLTPSGSRTVFRYDELGDENHDSSSTCSSLQSPPGSASALYCNVGKTPPEGKSGGHSPPGPIYQNPSALLTPTSAQSSQSNPIPSPAELTAAASPSSDTTTPPPQVNRKLKPDVNKPLLSPSPNKFPAYKHSSGAMTLPSRNNFRQLTVGPIIDRTRKPPESPLLLGPTPAQMKNQNLSGRHHGSSQFARSNTSTLPASPRRRAGPIISPHERLPVYHEYDQPDDLQGTYLQIDCKASGGNDTSPGESTRLHNSKVNLHKKGVPAQVKEGSVEYRLIDHVKTKALNKMREEREEQLQLVRTNPISLKSFT